MREKKTVHIVLKDLKFEFFHYVLSSVTHVQYELLKLTMFC